MRGRGKIKTMQYKYITVSSDNHKVNFHHWFVPSEDSQYIDMDRSFICSAYMCMCVCFRVCMCMHVYVDVCVLRVLLYLLVCLCVCARACRCRCAHVANAFTNVYN